MNLKLVLVLEALVFGLFGAITIYLTRFVKFFEVEWEVTILIANAFFSCFLLGLAFVFIRLRIDSDQERVRQTVSGSNWKIMGRKVF